MAAAMQMAPRSRDGCQTLVHGPQQKGYGRPVWGKVIRVQFDRYDAFAHGSPGAGRHDVRLGSFPSEAQAIQEVEAWARRTLTAEALAATFETMTAGGVAVTFLRRGRDGITGIVEHAGQLLQTTWGEDGLCNLFRCPATAEEHVLQRRFRLVWRQRDAAPASGPRATSLGMRA